ncbi:MAG: N-acetylmuramoyl-L-alanine amidase [Patulibacter sp.]|nr:N-acetylmuramoyl-L-alanine amidase [Patulibacter sp.]
MTRKVRVALVALALAAVALLAAVLGIDLPTSSDQPDREAIVTQPLAPAAIADPAQPDTIEIPADDLEQANEALDDHQDARDERPAGVPPAELDAGAQQQRDAAREDQLPPTAPLAAPAQAGCSSAFVRNYSSRGGVAPRIIVPHYTVSANRPGWGDVNAVVGWFNQARSGASSNYVVDDEAHCRYIVRESDKAWTQAGFNPWAISIEIINTGKEGRLTSAAGYRRLGQIISDSAERWNIPLRQGAIVGCRVTRSGIIDHGRLGSCGGNHHDIAPYPLQPVIDAAIAHRRGTTSTADPRYRLLVAGERKHVDELLYRRRVANRNGGWSKVAPLHLARASASRKWIRQRLRVIGAGSQANRPKRRAYLRKVESRPALLQP